ncbi:MAG: L-seryl-tRNA(Sec) selenium transferase [Gammaproteobacteria bacterium]
MKSVLQSIPSVDRVLSSPALAATLAIHGHSRCTAAIREVLKQLREDLLADDNSAIPTDADIAGKTAALLAADDLISLTRVINLTGTVLHTNLGRASLPSSAMAAIEDAATGAVNLEFDLAQGQRGDRDDHIENLIAELTGAEAATVVNNNAAAVLLALNSLAEGHEVCISRGELVEIGGSFRIPEVMQKSNCTLVELGATNRTHAKDYERAISPETALLLKVHTSNYEIRGFTQDVSYAELADIARRHGLPLMADLGSGTLVNLEDYGLEHEPTVQEVLTAGADIVTFSGDKLLGGPQAGIIAGRRDLINRIKRNPLKRALRVDKMTIAALAHVLRLYRNPDELAPALPTLRNLSRQPDDIRPMAEAVLPHLVVQLQGRASVTLCEVASQIGSGALPLDKLPSIALRIEPADGRDSTLQAISASLRALPTPVIGRLHDGAMYLDLRTLETADVLIFAIQGLSAP